jgi:hypothetical protein
MDREMRRQREINQFCKFDRLDEIGGSTMSAWARPSKPVMSASVQ